MEGPPLEDLFDAAMQVAHDRDAFDDLLALELQHEPEHAVGRRVLRSHVDDDAFLAEARSLLGDVRPVAAGGLERGDAVGGRVVDVGGGVGCARISHQL